MLLRGGNAGGNKSHKKNGIAIDIQPNNIVTWGSLHGSLPLSLSSTLLVLHRTYLPTS